MILRGKKLQFSTSRPSCQWKSKHNRRIDEISPTASRRNFIPKTIYVESNQLQIVLTKYYDKYQAFNHCAQ